MCCIKVRGNWGREEEERLGWWSALEEYKRERARDRVGVRRCGSGQAMASMVVVVGAKQQVLYWWHLHLHQ